jgi:chemosensory pili system protein ChpA (sensor histidine kinase/response regulator)
MPEVSDREFLRIFLMEAWDTLATLEDGLPRLGTAGALRVQDLDALAVVSHRLKGAAALHGFPALADIAGVAEELLERLPAMPAAERGTAAACLAELVPVLKTTFDAIGASGRESASAIDAFRARHPAFFGPSPDAGAATGAAPATPGAERAGGLRLELERFFAENADILQYFGPEAAEHLETMTTALLALEQRGRSDAELGTLFRAVHTLKGAAYTVGCGVVGDLAHRIEDLLAAVREDRVAFTAAAIEAVFAGIDGLRLLLGIAEGAPGDLEAVVGRALEGLDRLMPAAEPTEAPAAVAVEAAPAEALPGVAEESGTDDRPGERRAPASPGIRVSLDRLDALMNVVGELVIARSRLERRLQDLDRVGQLLAFSRSRMARAVKDFEAKHPYRPLPRVGPLEGGGPPLHEGPTPVSQLFAELEFDRYDDLDILGRSVTEMSADLAEVQTQLTALVRTVREDTGHIQRLTGSLRGEITRARMVPVGKLFARFARQVRETARATGKAVALQVSGESVEVDNTVIDQISDPILHLIQNAITHGIESEDERQSRGKSPQGTVYLSAYHRGGFVYVEVEDDGRGIDDRLLRERAVRQGFLRAEAAAALSEREALNLMFLPGFSTAQAVTTAAGRGVGLDVVRTNVGRLGGEIDVATELSTGTRFTLKLPLTVLISDALLVKSGGQTLAIPLNAVQVILRMRPAEIQTRDGRETVRVDDRVVELFRLERLLGLPAGQPARALPVVVLRAGGKSLALGVEELGGKEEIVIKGLGGFPEGIGPFAGATISGEGRVILLVDPGRLLKLAERTSSAAPGAPSPVAPSSPATRATGETPRRVLLVDDSISVRKFVGHMLQRAGFGVLTATDGAEALAQLTETTVDVVITDLEMPRVNGYELIEDLRRRPATRDLPVVVLTTRAGAKHVGLAQRLGVKHYVSKPVDEHTFVRLIDSLAAAAVADRAQSGAAR